jgi:hypothetical protein
VTANFNDAAINQVIDKLVSYALATGRFDSVNQHEPKNAPGTEMSCSVWADIISPYHSGLNSTSIVVDFQMRVYMSFTSKPYDMIDPKIMAAVTDIMGALSGDFNFGGVADVRFIDLLGATRGSSGGGGGRSQGLSARAGYVELDRHMYRVMTIFVPVVINDAFTQVA